MKIYKANRKGFINYLLIVFVLFPVVIFFLDLNTFSEKPFIMLPLLSPIIILFWIYFDTYYQIENDQLIYRCGFLRGKVEIPKIKEITKGKTMWVGVKPALAKNGLIIRFSAYDEIYIAPQSNEEMIADLLKVNPNINIVA